MDTENNLINSINDKDEIAIIGMVGRFPGANDIDGFWQNLQNGVESISFFSEEELASTGVEPALLSDHQYVKAGNILEDIELFDASFFGFTPREAEITDPQHRIFIECVWEALENAGYDSETYTGQIGLFAGTTFSDYLLSNLYPNQDLIKSGDTFLISIANEKDHLPTRVSYKLNLKGPSVNVQTACSTSLVAVHLACQSLLNGESDITLAGGVSIDVPQKTGYLYTEGGTNSPDGHCRAFDAQAQGTIFGSGLGVVVLKRLEDAVADGDRIHAIIKASAINNDGSLKVGYTAPSVDGQREVILEALALAGVEAETINYIETHGTATRLGDPIEITALTQAFRSSTDKKGFCAIGSAKTNVGHLETAAGVTGLIKTVLALKHQQIPPSLHFEKPNPQIDFANSPFFVNTKLSEWKTNGTPRRAGVSSFGIGGTNAHVILEEAPTIEASSPSRPYQLLLLSAKTSTALDSATVQLSDYLEQNPEIKLPDVAYTLQVGRRDFDYRRVVICQDLDDGVKSLHSQDPQRILSHHRKPGHTPVIFMFSGQGSQYANMGRELYEVEPTFKQHVDSCAEILQPHLGVDIRSLLYPKLEEIETASNQLQQTSFTQSALFVTEYALAKLLMSWGVHPGAMIGHSIGEYVAATIAGVFSLEDALKIVAKRGELMQQVPTGSMLAIKLAEKDVQLLLDGNKLYQECLQIAVINSPQSCVVSGTSEAVAALEEQLSAQEVECRQLHTSHAFHSVMMEPILEAFNEVFKTVKLNSPSIAFISNVTGNWISEQQATNPDYWCQHLRRTVRFSDGISQLIKQFEGVFLEVGPGRTLSTLTTQHLEKDAKQQVLTSLRHVKEKQSDVKFLLLSLGRLWLGGVEIDWSGFYTKERRHRIPLPTYPFERQRYWIEPNNQLQNEHQTPVSLGKKPDIADWFYIPFWKPSSSPAPIKHEELTIKNSCTLVFIDECGLGAQLLQRLQAQYQNVITVKVEDKFTQVNESVYTLNPSDSNDYDSLIKELLAQQKLPETIVHLWNITPASDIQSGITEVEKAQEIGFYSLVFLAQALGKQNLHEQLQITVVSNNMQSVTGGEVLSPQKATLLGPVKVIPQEYPNISCRSIDVVLPPTGSWQEEKLIEQILTELRLENSEQLIAYRGNNRWLQTFEPVRLDEAKGVRPRFRKGGVYLITGGLGGIGLVLAEHLAKTQQAKMILTGRSAFPPRDEWDSWLATHSETDSISRKLQKVQALEDLGAEVLVASADVANLEQMQTVVVQAQERFGSINGVIHAAGVPGGGIIQLKTPEDAQKILNPKVNGTVVLEELLKNLELDFFVLCSSVTSIYGGYGQVDYCGANQFLDAFAHYKNSTNGSLTVSINWDAWQEIGMAVEALKQLEQAPQLPKPQLKEVGHPLFDQCLLEGQDQEIYLSKFKVNEHWVLDEHRIMGKAILPGTAYLEMVRAAWENSTQQQTLEIREVYFLKPLIVEDSQEKEVRTILQNRGEVVEFLVMSQSDSGSEPWIEHARGKIARLESEPPEKLVIEELEAQCNQQKLIIAKQELTTESEFQKLGKRWNNLEWIQYGENQSIALLELPEEYANDLNSYQLHPALLDIANGSFSFCLKFHDESFYLPFYYKSLKIKGPLSKKIYSYIRVVENNELPGETLKFNITILNQQGTKLVEIEEYTLRQVNNQGKTDKSATQQSRVPSENFYKETTETGASANILPRDFRQDWLSPSEGINVFERILANTFSQVLVSTSDLLTWSEYNNTYEDLISLKNLENLSQLIQTTHSRPELNNAYILPRNEIEQVVAKIWQEVLGINNVGIQDNFFELGGDSLLATQIISWINKTLHIELSINSMFEIPTVAGISEQIENMRLTTQKQQNSTTATLGKRERGVL